MAVPATSPPPSDSALELVPQVAPRSRSFLWPSLAVALGSRVALYALAFYAVPNLVRVHVGASLRTPAAQVFHGWEGRLLNPWAHWDGVWYIRIAAHGYAAFPDSQAFFPLYPLLVRWLGRALGGEYELAGIILSLACFLAMCALLYKLVARRFTARVAFSTIAFLCLFPTSLFLQTVYTDSLFLLLVVACFYFSHRGTWFVAGLAGFLAALTHVTGSILVLPMALLYMEERGWSLRSIGPSVASILLVPAGLLLWMYYLAVAFFDPLLFRHVEGHWGRHFAWPWATVVRGVQVVVYDVRGEAYLPLTIHRGERVGDHLARYYAAHPSLVDALLFGNVSALAALVLAATLIALGVRRLPLAYTAYAIAVMLLPLFGPTALKPLMSLPRFILAAFPLFIVLALLTDRRPLLRTVLLVASTAALALCTIRFAGFLWVA